MKTKKAKRVVKTPKQLLEKPALRLDLGCGQNPHIPPSGEKFKGVDLYAAADFKVDLTKFPWPFEDDSVDEVFCSHFFEHVPGRLRGQWMDELFRILKPGAKATIIVPAYNSVRAIQDFTHEWPPIGPESFWYFTKGFREGNKLNHGPYDLKCDFLLTQTGTLDAAWVSRQPEVQQQAARQYMNVMLDYVTVMQKPAPPAA